jgi:hypothetical protein
VFTRQDVWALETPTSWSPTIRAYALGVRALQTPIPGDLSRWDQLAAIHGTTCRPDRPLWNECRHSSWHFFPWHRMYLYYVERILRDVIVDLGGPADWALPFWDYSRPFASDALPVAFRTEAMPDGTPNPLFVQERAPGINDGLRMDARITTPLPGAMNITNFNRPPSPSFGGGVTDDVHFLRERGAIENTPHDVVHVALGGEFGGWMADPMLAAKDPIFWLHHANIDRLWSVWAHDHANPSDQTWHDKTFQFSDVGFVTTTRRIGDTLDTVVDLEYTYPGLPEAPEVGAGAGGPGPTPPTEGAESMPELLGGTSQAVELVGDVESVPIKVERGTLGEEVLDQPIYVSLENVDADRPPGKVYGVYVEVDGAGDAPTHVGNLTLFGIDREHPRGGGDADRHDDRLVFDITDAVGPVLAGDAALDTVRVTFQPFGLVGDAGETAESVAAPRAIPIRVGHISIYRG